jgi:hypothetical protein
VFDIVYESPYKDGFSTSGWPRDHTGDFIRNVDGVDFQQGLPDLDNLDPREKHLIILDDLMDETDQRVASLFTKKSHHRNILFLPGKDMTS